MEEIAKQFEKAFGLLYSDENGKTLYAPLVELLFYWTVNSVNAVLRKHELDVDVDSHDKRLLAMRRLNSKLGREIFSLKSISAMDSLKKLRRGMSYYGRRNGDAVSKAKELAGVVISDCNKAG